MTAPLPKIMLTRTEGVIDLAWGHPSDRLHPLQALRPAMDRVFSRGDVAALQYSGYQGYGPLIESLSGFLSAEPCYDRPVATEELYIGYGASHGLDVACTLFTRTGDVVWVEEPSYYLVRQILVDHGLEIVGVPTDANGIDVKAAERMLDAGELPAPALVYCIPSYHNPLGGVMPAGRRRALAALAESRGFLVAADEAYHLLHHDSPPPPPLASFDRSDEGCVVSLGSFSKVLAPGIKLGWVQARPALVDRYTHAGANYSGGNNNLAAAIVDECDQVRDARRPPADAEGHLPRAFAAVMVKGLRSELPDADFRAPSGGYYFWAALPEGADAVELERRAPGAGVTFRAGPAFSGEGLFTNCLRLCFAMSESDEILEGLRRLGALYGELRHP